MAIPWKVGDRVFYRRMGELQCSARTITHIWEDQGKALMDNGDIKALDDDLLPAPPVAGMKFALKQQVAIAVSGERGQVTGRSEFTDGAPLYRVHYKAADGRAVHDWWMEEALEPVVSE